MRFRAAGASDARAVAELHADSWRRHYRGAYSDAFLDGDVETERIEAWTERLTRLDTDTYTVLAEDDRGLVGFSHTIFEADPAWGALLDNLHVVYGHKRRGVGSRLLALTTQAVLERRTGLYLWVASTAPRSSCGAPGAGTLCARWPSPLPGLGLRLIMNTR